MRAHAVAAFAMLAACTTTPPPDPQDTALERLTALLAGDYFSAAEGGVREGRPIYMRIRPVTPPAGKRFALYAEMRHDNASGELYRQRLYLFDEAPGRAANTMTALAFEDSAAAARLITEPGLAPRLATKEPLAPGCVTAWREEGAGFVGRVDPAACQITGRRGDQRRIESVTRIDAGAIGQLERGYDLGGKLLFGNPTDELYVWPRVGH
jgi:hypothetical protein